MPTYEYRCPKCGHTFDVFQRMTDEPGARCPECDSECERVVSGGAGFLFKGDGFYITETRSKEYRDKAKAESGGDSTSPDTSGAKPPESGSSDGASAPDSSTP